MGYVRATDTPPSHRNSLRDHLARTSLSERTWPLAPLSDAGVPGVTTFRRRRPQAFAEPFQTIAYRQARDIFHALVAELSGDAQTNRSAVADGKLTAIHPVSYESLRMQRIRHIDAVPPVGLYREIDNISGLRKNPHEVQDVR